MRTYYLTALLPVIVKGNYSEKCGCIKVGKTDYEEEKPVKLIVEKDRKMGEGEENEMKRIFFG